LKVLPDGVGLLRDRAREGLKPTGNPHVS